MTQHKGSSEDEFRAFANAAAEHFAFLETNFGFHRDGQFKSWRDMEIAYEQGLTKVGVGYELLSDPWVYLDFSSGIRRERFGLHVVLEAATGTADALRSVELARDIAEKVAVLAALVRNHASDLLRGNNARLAVLRELHKRHVREQNQQTFGTATGETPVFQERPSLQALFAGPQSDDVRAARVYQALWDYNYTKNDIASELGVTTAVVDTLIAQWERHL